jgi:hypothetical protein
MRYNLDCGVMNPKGGVTYAALEILGRHGKPLTIGIGMSTSAMDERVRQWGIIKECPIADIPFIIEDEGGRRPVNRLELKERLGSARGYYKDSVSYRNELAVRLFADLENYREICRFLAMGKAYREIASQASDYHELFKSLLPEPRTEIFERIIEALRTLDESRTVLDDLERKLLYLKNLHEFITIIATNKEALVRYQWLSSHHKAAIAGHENKSLQQLIYQSQLEIEKLGLQLLEEEQLEAATRIRFDDLKTKDALGLVRQEKEGRDELTRKNRELDSQKKLCLDVDKQHRNLAKNLAEQQKLLKKTIVTLHTDLAKMASLLPFSISEFLTQLDDLHREENCAAGTRSLDTTLLLNLMEKERDTTLVEKARLEQDISQLENTINISQKNIEHLHTRKETTPDLPGFSECLLAMREKMLTPLPLYKGLEWRPGLDRREADRIEEFIGIDRSAMLLFTDNQFEAGREIAVNFPGIRVTCHSRGAENIPEWMRSAFDFKESDPYAFRCLASEMICDFGPIVTRINGKDILSFRSHDRCLSGSSCRLIGETSRQEALQEQIHIAETRLQTLTREKNTLLRQLKTIQQTVALLDGFRNTLAKGFRLIQDHAAKSSEIEQEYNKIHDILAIHQQRQLDLDRETSLLHQRLIELDRMIRQEGLETLEKKISSLSRELTKRKETITRIYTRRGEIQGAINGDEKRCAELIGMQNTALAARQQTEEQLKVLLPEIDDMQHYILRTKKGFQFKTLDSVQKEKENCEKTIVENRSVLKERLNDPEFGASFRFTYEEVTNALFDFRSRQLDEIISQQGGEIAEQKEIINDRTKELFKKIIMTELVNYLRTHVSDLDRMIDKIRALLEKRSFGGQQYRFRIKPLEKYRRMVSVIKKFSSFDPAAEEELKHFFEDHAADIINTEVGAIPEELDYRNWYRYEMEVATVGDQGVVMDRRTKSVGSGGEQAVPNYLLVLTIAHFLYHGRNIRLHTLLFDEAFYGIDAGRRDQLLGFATDLNLQLFVASPDQDGVRQEISYSTTLLVKKDLNFDVHLFPYHWENPDNIKQVSLFDQPKETKPIAFDEEL